MAFCISFRASDEATSVCFRSCAILICKSRSSPRTGCSKTSFCRSVYSLIASRASFVSRTMLSVVVVLDCSSAATLQGALTCQMPMTQLSIRILPSSGLFLESCRYQTAKVLSGALYHRRSGGCLLAAKPTGPIGNSPVKVLPAGTDKKLQRRYPPTLICVSYER
jgi:hypothetical protein